MHISRFLGALAMGALILSTAPVQAAMSAPPGVNLSMNSRFGGPGVYAGAPALGVTLAVVVAGGGPKEEFYRDLFWALLNTREFAFNH